MDWINVHGGWPVWISGGFAFITAIITVGGGIWTARKSRKTSEKLAEQQKEYTAQIETLKNQLAFDLARKTKFAEKEFEVLGECWQQTAHIITIFVNLDYSVRELDKLYNGDITFLEFMNQGDLSNIKHSFAVFSLSKEQVKSIKQKDNKFDKAIWLINYNIVNIDRNYLDYSKGAFDFFSQNKIFVEPKIQDNIFNIFDQFSELMAKTQLISDIFFDKGMKAQKDRMPLIMNDMNIHRKYIGTIRSNLEKAINLRLFPEEIAAMKKEQAGSGGES